jgi:hypothetical protein
MKYASSKRSFPILLLILTALFLPAALSAEESPYEYRVLFSDTMKINDFNLEHNIIDTFEFEGTVHWTENTELYGRIKLDNWSDSVGGILFGSEIDQRYGMSHSEIIDKIYIRSMILEEIGIEGAPYLEILGGYNAGGVLHEEWTAFDFENYRLAGIGGVVFQSDVAVWKDLYLTTSFNPAFGSSNPVWKGINGALSDDVDLLAALSWRSDSWWTELYWDSYSNSNASNQGSDLSVFGASAYLNTKLGKNTDIKLSERLEYGLNSSSSGKDHMRYSLAAGLDVKLLKGLKSNVSFNGFFLDRKEMNLGWDTELMVTDSLGAIAALGGIRLADDPDFIYEIGVSGHYNYLSLYFGYSDHKGGNEGWFSGAFDTTRNSNEGVFLRLDVEY